MRRLYVSSPTHSFAYLHHWMQDSMSLKTSKPHLLHFTEISFENTSTSSPHCGHFLIVRVGVRILAAPGQRSNIQLYSPFRFKGVRGVNTLAIANGTHEMDPHQARPFTLSDQESGNLNAFFLRRRIPAIVEKGIEDYISKKTGMPWKDPVALDRLRKAIMSQKEDYWKPAQQRTLRYTKGYSVLAYLAYHFPVYYMQTEYLLAMLARDGLLKPTVNILDAGSGPGVASLAIADFYSRLDSARAVVHSVERSEEHIEAFQFLRDQCTSAGTNVSIKKPIAMDISNPNLEKIPGKIDLIIFSNVLNELPGEDIQSHADVVEKISKRLSPDGSILVIEPADEDNATRMRQLVIALVKRGFSIYSPCTFLWGSLCGAPRCWSFTTAPPIHPPRMMEVLGSGPEGYRFLNTDIKYSFAVLRKDGRVKHECRMPAGAKFLRFSHLSDHIGKRVNVVAAKMSGELGNARTHVIKVCDATANVPVYAVVPSYHVTQDNSLILEAGYGSLLEFQGVLVRYNKTHDAYNLLITRNTKIKALVNA